MTAIPLERTLENLRNRLRASPAARPLAVTILIAVVVRGIGLLLPPRVFPDTFGYVQLAYRIWKLRLAGYDGGRTPVFPLLLLFSAANFHVVVFLQSLLGIGIAVMLFEMVYRRTASTGFALAAGVFYSVDLSQIFFEQAILSETACAFLLTLSAAVFQWMVLERRFARREQAALGTMTALTALTRPQYAYLAPLYFILIALAPSQFPESPEVRVSRRERVARLASFAAPAGGLLLAWCLFNWINIGFFGLSTRIGFSLINHSGAFFELAPDKYAAIRDPYLKARALQIATEGTHVNAIFKAEPEIFERTGYSDLQLSRELTRMSLELFAAHPMLYAQSVMRGWVSFWQPPLHRGRPFLGWPLENSFRSQPPRSRGLERALVVIGLAEVRLLVLANFVFLVSALWLAARFVVRRERWGFDLSAIAIVLAASLLQAIIEFGDGSRYSVPTAPLVLYIVVVSVWRLSRARSPRAIRNAASLN